MFGAGQKLSGIMKMVFTKLTPGPVSRALFGIFAEKAKHEALDLLYLTTLRQFCP